MSITKYSLREEEKEKEEPELIQIGAQKNLSFRNCLRCGEEGFGSAHAIFERREDGFKVGFLQALDKYVDRAGRKWR